MHQRRASEEIYRQLCEVIPGGVNSPVRSCKGVKQLPMVAERGFQDQLVDVDGSHYIDYCGSWGALIHGHAHPAILEAASKKMADGTTFGITTAIEGMLAQKIVNTMPSIEKIRFVSTGTEATMSAVRLARGFTGKKVIIKFIGNFHGHADFFLVQAGSGLVGLSPTSSSAGVPAEVVQHMLCLPYNDIETCRQVLNERDDIAAIILEPIVGNMGVIPATDAFIHFLREETQKLGVLLIFDEVITGFRVAHKGAQDLYQVKPGLTTLGKIIGGGFPAAAFGGRRDIMDYLAPLGPVYQSGTLSGNPVAMAAGLQALTLLEEEGFYAELERKTKRLTVPLNAFIKKHDIPACIQEVGSMFTLFFGLKKVENMDDVNKLDFEEYGRFFRYMFSHGVYLPPLQVEPWFVSSAHTDDHIDATCDLLQQYLSDSEKN